MSTTPPLPTAASALTSGEAAARHRMVRALTVGLLLLGAAAVMLQPGSGPFGPVDGSGHWLVLAAGAWLAAALPVRVRLGGSGLDVSAVDAVIAAGLWLVPADELALAVLLGALLHLGLVRGQRGVALLFNVALTLLHVVLAAQLLGLLVTPGDRVDLAATILATGLAAVATSLLVLLVAVLAEGEQALDATAGLVAANLVVSVAAGSAGAMVAEQAIAGGVWWVPLLPLLLTVAVVAAHARAHGRAAGLSRVIETTRTVHAADGPVDALRTMVEEIAAHFEADGAELHRLPRDGGTPVRFSVGVDADPSGVLRGERGDDDLAELLPRSTTRRVTAGWAMSMRVVVPDGDAVRVRVHRLPGTAHAFTRHDVQLFAEMCRAAVMSFETSQMQETLARLQELDEMKTAFLTAVSHDLRTPLAVVLGGLMTLARKHEQLTPGQRDLLFERMVAQGRRLDQMLLDLLDIDRLQRGVLEPRREEVDVTGEVVTTVEAVGASTHPVRVSTAPVPGFVDRGHVARIVENLVRNAVKYTPAGTPIWIDVRKDATGVQLIVSDAGPGVPVEQRAAIFGAFVRGDDSHPSPGTGVGLDLVRRLAELHGGRAWVDERPGGGARFWVTLPDSRAAGRRAAITV